MKEALSDGRMYTMGREIDLYDIVYIPIGNPCNLKKQEHKNPVPILAKKKKLSPSSPWGFSPDPKLSERCSPMPPRP
jgi:hypothetical protein